MDTPKSYNYTAHIIVLAIVGFVAGIVGSLVTPTLYSTFSSHSTSDSSPLFAPVVKEESAIIDVVKNANPAVVSIVIKKDLSQLQNTGPQFFPFGDIFDFGFPTVDPRGENDIDAEPFFQRVGGGSGFIVESGGLIVTNKHVVSDESALYTVVLSDGSEYEATVVGRDPVFDLALLDIEADNLPTLRLGDSDSLQIGQSVVAIGYALAEYGNTVTTGVVSGVGRRVEAGDGRGMSEVLEEAIQTDAAINPGNSGGPLLDLRGNVVGINTAVSSEGQLLGFAIPINQLKNTIETVQREGRIVRPWLGVRYIPVTPRLAELNNLSVTYGALILRGDTQDELAVIPGSPADKADLQENDIVLEIDGKKLEDKDSLVKIISSYHVGDTIEVLLLHDGEEKTVEIKLEEFPVEN